jgi:hypothetical protein
METNNAILCPTCHQAILLEYYFCPNCGTKLRMPPLSASFTTQTKLYMHSIILPLLCFITISKWRAFDYLKSNEKGMRQIGMTACLLLLLSTVAFGWYATVLTRSIVQSQVDSLNGDLGGY